MFVCCVLARASEALDIGRVVKIIIVQSEAQDMILVSTSSLCCSMMHMWFGFCRQC